MKARKKTVPTPAAETAGQLRGHLNSIGDYIVQARGVVELVIALKPTTDQVNDWEMIHALYAAVDQLNRACDIVDGKAQS
jgi:predicted RNA polymerase sigma factor